MREAPLRLVHRGLIIVLIAFIPFATASDDSIRFLGDQHATFSDTYQHSSVVHEFVVQNDSQQTITIVEAFALTKPGTVTVEPATIQPGRRALIRVSQPVGSRLGRTAFRFAIVTDEPNRPKHRFSLSGFVQSPYDPESVHIDLGFIERKSGTTESFELFSRETTRLHLVDTASDRPGIAVAATQTGLLNEGIEVSLTLAPGLPRGILHGSVELVTNLESQPRFDASYSANVFDDVVPSENPVALGLVRAGHEVVRTIVLQSLSGEAFSIERCTNTIGEILEVSWSACDGQADGPSPCYEVRFSLSPDQVQPANGIADLYVAGDPQPVPLTVTSWVVSPHTVIKHLGSPASQGHTGVDP